MELPSPAAIAADIRNTPVTKNPVPHPVPPGAAVPSDELCEELFHLCSHPDSKLIRRLKKAIADYPHTPSFKNLLYVSLDRMGRRRSSHKVLLDTCKKHPDYLFGIVNLASHHCTEEKEDKALELIGAHLSLRKFSPNTKIFHLTEFSGYYRVALLYLISSNEHTRAKAMIDALRQSGNFDPQELDGYSEKLAYSEVSARFKKFTENHSDYKKNIIQPVIPKPKRSSTSTEHPEFHHHQVNDLYKYDSEIGPKTLQEILTLPRATLIEDMLTLLRDSRERLPHFEKLALKRDFDSLNFPLHALMILGEINAGETVGEILTFLEAHPDELNIYMENCWHMLNDSHHYQLYTDHWEAGLAWMKKPNIATDAKTHLIYMAWNTLRSSPKQRAPMLEWFNDVLTSQLQANRGDQLLDSVLVGNIIDYLILAKAEESIPLIRKAYGAGIVSHLFHVTEEDAIVGIDSATPPASFESRSMLDIYQASLEDDSEDDFLDEDTIPPFLMNTPLSGNSSTTTAPHTQPSSVPQKISRNAPCPCGSGKKYKQCCLTH